MLLITSALNTAECEPALIEACLTRIADGDIEAMGPLYEMTSSSIFAYALSLLRNRTEAEDILHDTYLAINRAAAGYRPQGKPMAWIMTVVKNLSISRLRVLNRTARLEEEDWNSLLRVEDVPSNLPVAEALKKLSEDERQVVLLHAVSGFKHRETASLLGLPLGSVLSLHSRAIKKLKKHLQEGDEI